MQVRGKLSGMPGQIEWAEQIKPRVNAEFDRVASALTAAAGSRSEDLLVVIAILEEKRAEVMAINDAGYFITVWQELTDQVRRMIAMDPRYRAMQARKTQRKVGTNE